MKYTKHNTIEPENEYDEVYLQLLRFCCAGIEKFEDTFFVNNCIKALNNLPQYPNLHFRLIPFMLQKVKELNLSDKISSNVLNLLKNKTQKGVVAELGKHNQILEIIKEFSRQNIPIILLKSAAFNGVIYSTDFPRLSNDIDILVKRNDWNKAIGILSISMKKQDVTRRRIFDDTYETSFIPKTNVGANVDLHMALAHPFLGCAEEQILWSSSQPHPVFKNSMVRVLDSHYAVFHLLLHNAKDLNLLSYSTIDIIYLIEKVGFNLDTLWDSEFPSKHYQKLSLNIMNTMFFEKKLTFKGDSDLFTLGERFMLSAVGNIKNRYIRKYFFYSYFSQSFFKLNQRIFRSFVEKIFAEAIT